MMSISSGIWPGRWALTMRWAGFTHPISTKPAADYDLLARTKKLYEDNGFHLVGLEPAPLNQCIKMNLPGRDREIENMITLVTNMGKLGIEVLCFNFMAHFGWLRTHYDIPERGGARVTGYDHRVMENQPPTERGIVTEQSLWDNLRYLLCAIVPAAEKAGVQLALHPDDPPVSPIRGISRILTSADAMERAVRLVPSPNLGITFCQGCFGAMGEDIVSCIRRFGRKGLIKYVHFRDVRGNRYQFHETFHDNGPTDMAACIRAYREVGFDGYARVDHVPTMAGEENEQPGYEAMGRLYAAGYLKGLLEMSEYMDRSQSHV